MKSATIQVDVAAIRFAADGVNLGSEPLKEFRREMGGRSIRTIEHQRKTLQGHANGRREVIDVLLVELFVDDQRLTRRFEFGLEQSEDLALQLVFLRVWKLEPRVIENLKTVVPIGVVRCGDHHAGDKGSGAGEVRNPGRGYETGEPGADAAFREAASNRLGQPW